LKAHGTTHDGTAAPPVAVTINLNDDYEGGELSFPDMAAQLQAADDVRWCFLARFCTPSRHSRAAAAMHSCRFSMMRRQRRSGTEQPLPC